MTPTLAALAALLFLQTTVSAHRLDEYLQATTLTIEKHRILAQTRLNPGVAVLPFVLAGIDADSDGVVSQAEGVAYAGRMLRDLSLSIDGIRCPLRLTAVKLATAEELREGRGEIQIEWNAEVPGGGGQRRLTFENHHHSRIAAYLVNCLVPRDPTIRVTAQDRNYEQSVYQLHYQQDDPALRQFAWWPTVGEGPSAAALLLFGLTGWLWRKRRELSKR